MHHKPRFAAPGEVTIERDGPYALTERDLVDEVIKELKMEWDD